MVLVPPSPRDQPAGWVSLRPTPWSGVISAGAFPCFGGVELSGVPGCFVALGLGPCFRAGVQLELEAPAWSAQPARSLNSPAGAVLGERRPARVTARSQEA